MLETLTEIVTAKCIAAARQELANCGFDLDEGLYRDNADFSLEDAVRDLILHGTTCDNRLLL